MQDGYRTDKQADHVLQVRRTGKRVIADRAGADGSKNRMGERGADARQGVPGGAADKTGADL